MLSLFAQRTEDLDPKSLRAGELNSSTPGDVFNNGPTGHEGTRIHLLIIGVLLSIE